jgi:hypothetical protein
MGWEDGHKMVVGIDKWLQTVSLYWTGNILEVLRKTTKDVGQTVSYLAEIENQLISECKSHFIVPSAQWRLQ